MIIFNPFTVKFDTTGESLSEGTHRLTEKTESEYTLSRKLRRQKDLSGFITSYLIKMNLEIVYYESFMDRKAVITH